MDDVRPALLQDLYGDPFPVHSQVTDADPARPVDLGDLGIAGIFHGIDPLPSQKLQDQAVEIFRTGAHNDLAGIRMHASEFQKMACDGFPQAPDPSAGSPFHQLPALVRNDAPHGPGPGGEGKELGQGGIGGKIIKDPVVLLPVQIRNKDRPALPRALPGTDKAPVDP